MDYYLFDGDWRAPYCMLGYIQGFEDDYKLTRGDALAQQWPANVSFYMDEDFKKRIKLSDNLLNPENIIIASPKLVGLLQAQQVKNIEYLPVTIYNHKKRVASTEYHIAHLVTTQDCIDVAKSGVDWSSTNSNYIFSMKSLIIDKTRIHKDAAIFRAKHLRNAMFVRQDLADHIQQAGLTGIAIRQLSEYRG